MLAYAANWPGCPGGSGSDLSDALAGALCAGVGGNAAPLTIDNQHFAWRPLDQRAANLAWSPARTADGRLVVFHGWIDNAAAIAAATGTEAASGAALYAAALDHWGEAADRKIIGEYCAIVSDPGSGHVRLSRSPLRAPPLVYAANETTVAAASVPRAIFAAGFDRQLNEAHLADCAVLNFSDPESSWFRGIAKVPVGCVVALEPGQPRQLRRYYDLASIPQVRLADRQSYVARAAELLDEAVAAVTAPFDRPGATLSGGLDSPQVAARAARLLAPGRRLPTFTFHPEPEWDGIEAVGACGDERPAVSAFAALHARIEPHFTDNRGRGHDYRWADMIRAMDGASGTLCNMYVYHGLCDGARAAGCDVLLISEWGNNTFSAKGEWGFVEYLRTGRWRQLWLALKHHPFDQRSMLRRFVALCLVPFLPRQAWQWLMKTWHKGDQRLRDLFVPLRRDYRASSGADRRLAARQLDVDRYQPLSQAHARKLLFANADGELAEVYQAFEQVYGVPLRDPLAYRPFVEFCLGLPTDLFLHDGVQRWLARELAKDIMPEAQRLDERNGRWDADWLHRIRRRAADYREELDRIGDDPEIGTMLDLPRLRGLLEDMPERTETDPQKYMAIEFGLPRGLLLARFVNHVRGRN